MPGSSSNAFYSLVLGLHLLIIALDLVFNTASTFFNNWNEALLLLFILQDTLQAMGIMVLAITFSSTFVFEAGLIGVLLKKFGSTFIIALLYLALSILLHITSLRERWASRGKAFVWPTYLVGLFVIQRLLSVFHYFLYKRAIMLLSHPRYHADSEWLREKIRKWT